VGWRAWREAVEARRHGLGATVLGATLSSCSGVLDPQGPIGGSEKIILLDSLAIMLAIAAPVIVVTLTFAWWFRASNLKARYLPDWSYSGRLELMVWSVPLMVILFLGGIGWIGAHDLDPDKPIASRAKPLEVQVISLDWKWLFIYPDQGVASVNQLVIPVDVPVHFSLTSASVMNSFFVPQLGSQIYAMAGMTTRLNLEADRPGTYPGISAQFSGAGFSDMQFTVAAVAPGRFSTWVSAAKTGGAMLDAATYSRLAKPSQANPVATYGRVTPQLFETIVGLSAPGTIAAHPMPPHAAPISNGRD